tara:strand:- start:205202 stop:205687 length:486 start_codon:yes stop_codon:yes gene_type:complete
MGESSTPNEEPRIVVDTDWKEQVEKEKQQLAGDEQSQAETVEDISDFIAKESDDAPIDRAGETGMDETNAGEAGAGEMPAPPPATFEVLVSLLFTQAMGTLGHMPNPTTGKAEVNKAYAKHYIDTLEMLGEKTNGNLTDDEKKMLSEALHALRMAYVNARD